MKANEALYEDKAKMWLKRDKGDDPPAGGDAKKSLDYEDDNQVPDGSQGGGGGGGKDKDADSR